MVVSRNRNAVMQKLPQVQRRHVLLLWLTLLGVLVTPIHGFASPTKRSSGGGFGKVQKSKESPTSYQLDESDAVQSLFQFLKQFQGCNVNHVAVGKDPTTGRRGLYTTKNFGKDEAILVKIPSDCALALQDPNNQQTTTTLPQDGLSLLQRYWKDSQARKMWAPYLDTLPTVITSRTPDLYSEEEIDLLEFPRLVQQAKARRDELNALATEHAPSTTLEELQWATWIVSSRSFPLAISDPSVKTTKDNEPELDWSYDDRGQVVAKAQRNHVRVLVPLLDLANHSNKANARLTLVDAHKDEAFFCLTSTRPISAGKEITVAYGGGVASSVELLGNYGFVQANNPVDSYMLGKGGDDCFSSLEEWTTTLEEDESMLGMLESEEGEESPLLNILEFRRQLKRAYTDTSE